MIGNSGNYRSLVILVAGVLVWTLCMVSPSLAQSGRLTAGTEIPVRTTEDINTNNSDGRIYRGVVDQDVRDSRGNLAISRGSDVEMVVRRAANNELVLDLDSVLVNGQRFGIETQETTITGAERRDGLGANSRTGKYVGGGALLGAIIGAVAGGGKGAAIGAGAGAAAGAGAQIFTRGSRVNVPAETLVTFRLDEPMRTPTVDSGFLRDGQHYHRGYGYDPDDRNYDNSRNNNDNSRYGNSANIRIDRDNRVRWWNAPTGSRVYVIQDNGRARLFASGPSGNQDAPWIARGHRYTFVLRDRAGNEIARDQVDLRRAE
jgi:hypothetical protein